MADKKPQPRRLTLSNTKQEMLDSYNDLVKQLQEKREVEIKPQEKVEEKAKQQIVAAADSLSTEGIVQSMSMLKGEIGILLGQLSDRLEEEVGKYRQVKRALEVKEAETQEMYEIQKSASSLAALIEAQHQKRYEFETEMAAEKEDLEQEIQTRRVDWEQERKRHDAEIKERDAAEAKRREREKEEYLYTFQREQQLARDQVDDEKLRLEREIQTTRERMERELGDRENAVAENETELNALRERVNAFPNELESAVNTAVTTSVGQIQWEARTKEELLRKEFEGERNVLLTRIESLEKAVKEQYEQITKLSQQTEQAYGQVQTMAVKAIEGASHLQSVSNLQQLVAEQTRKSSQEK